MKSKVPGSLSPPATRHRMASKLDSAMPWLSLQPLPRETVGLGFEVARVPGVEQRGRGAQDAGDGADVAEQRRWRWP